KRCARSRRMLERTRMLAKPCSRAQASAAASNVLPTRRPRAVSDTTNAASSAKGSAISRRRGSICANPPSLPCGSTATSTTPAWCATTPSNRRRTAAASAGYPNWPDNTANAVASSVVAARISIDDVRDGLSLARHAPGASRRPPSCGRGELFFPLHLRKAERSERARGARGDEASFHASLSGSGQSLSTRLCVRRDHACHDLGNLLAGRNVQKLVRAVRVGMRAQYAGDEELRLREFFAQHAHERNAAALAHVRGRRTERVPRGLRYRAVEPTGKFRGVPAAAVLFELERDLRAVRRIFFQQALHEFAGLAAVRGRRHAQAELQRGERPQHVARVFQRRQTGHAGDRELRAPGAVEDQLDAILADRSHAVLPGKLVEHLVAKDLRALLRLLDTFGRHLHVQFLRHDRATD